MFWIPFLVSLLLIWFVLQSCRTSKLPPGPRGLPLLGNVFQMPTKLLFLKLDEWKNEFGEIYRVDVAGRLFIVLNSAKASAEILERRSAVTSGRPVFVMAGEIMTRNLLYIFLQGGERWRRLRRVTHETFNVRAAEAFYPVQESEMKNFVKRVLVDQSHMQKQLQRLTAAVTWRALYAAPSITPKDEEKQKKMDDITTSMLHATMPMAYIVDILPFLNYLPAWVAGWKRQGIRFFHDTDDYYMELFNHGRHDKEDAGFVVSAAKARETYGVTEQEIAWTAGGLFGAGVETTAVAVHWFILAMVLNPEIAKKGQEQIDSVCGNRPPSFADRNRLPYIQAMVKEILRWRPVAPAGIPHVATEDIVYGDYVIPSGAFLIGNIWSMSRDPEIFPDYEVYRPERFLDSTGDLKDALPDYRDDVVAYGFGRRICPGKDLANNSLFIDIAYLLWSFDFCKVVDDQGQEITPTAMAFSDQGLTVHPAPFPYQLKPRADHVSQL